MNPQTQFSPPARQAHFDFLVETVASHLHLQAVEVVTITVSVSAALRTQDATLLRSCRNLLGDNGKPMLLALKYGGEIGLSGALVTRLNALYANLTDGKRALTALLAAHGATLPHAQLQTHSQWWRRAAAETLKAVDLFDEAERGSLNAVYAEDARAVRQALQKAADGDPSLLDRFGRLVAPTLRQRRQSPRLAVQRTGTLHLSTGAVQVRIEDISREGLGIVCPQPLKVGQELTITLDDGARLEAVVATARDSFYGLSLRSRLSERDILSGATR